MKKIKLISSIGILLAIVYFIVEYVGHVKLAHPIDAIIYSFICLIIIIFFIESKKFAYLLILLTSYSIHIPIFSMEVLLFNENKKNHQWFRDRYNYKTFKLEFYIFSPIIFLLYLLFFSYGKNSKKFSINKILLEMNKILKSSENV